MKLSPEKIREEAECFRKKYIFSENLPVDIEHIVEAALGVYVIPQPNLQKECDMAD